MWQKLILYFEVDNILLSVLLTYLPSQYRSSFEKDFLSSVGINESISMSPFMEHLRKSKVLAAQKKRVDATSKPWLLWLQACCYLHYE